MPVYTSDDLRSFLPHRYPFIFVDRIDSVEPGKSCVARKNVTINEPFFQGHFPQESVMPGVLILETIAQAAVAPMMAQLEAEGKPFEQFMGYLGGIDKVRFRRKVVPGDVLMIEIEYLKQRGQVAVIKGVASVDGERAVTCEMTVIFEMKDK